MKDLCELAKQFVCMIIAATLSLTVSVVESMLPRRPDWLEKSPRWKPNSGRFPMETRPAMGRVDGYSKLLEIT